MGELCLGATSEGEFGEDGVLGNGGTGRGRGVSGIKGCCSLTAEGTSGTWLGSLKLNRLINLHKEDEYV